MENKTEITLIKKLSPFSSCEICRYFLSDMCETCLDDINKTSFTPRRNLLLEDMPPFPRIDFENGMPVKMRQAVVAVYMEKMMERLQGIR